jgi:hypothetical protein
MNDDLTDRLRDLPPELPDVTDRVDRVRRLVVRRRRRQVGLAAVATAIAVAVPVTVVSGLPNSSPPPRPAPHSTPSKLRAVATDCPHRGLSIRTLPPSIRPTHSASQVRATFRRHAGTVTTIVPAYVEDPVAAKVGLGGPTKPRLMWVVSLLTNAPEPRRTGDSGASAHFTYPYTVLTSLDLVDDAALASAGTFSCPPINATRSQRSGVSGYGIATGSRVAATGSIGPAGTGFVVCFVGGAILGEPTDTEPACADQVALIGMTRALATWADQSRYVSGIWRPDGLHVTSIGPPHDDDGDSALTTPPCATPPGGWATVASSPTPNLDDSAFQHYKASHPGVVAAVAFFRPSNLQPVLTIASTDPAATRVALASSYPRALCVVRSRFTEAQLHRAKGVVKQAFLASRLPGVSAEGSGVDRQGQPIIDLTALNDRPEIHRVLADVTPGLLRIDPWLHILAPPPT